MNRVELEKFKLSGPCTCGSADCWYCSAVGDFKFLWAVANAERGLYANQLQRALEIASALSEYVNCSESSLDWCDMLSKLVAEVEFKPSKENYTYEL
jgi:hypothetical protein